MRTVHESGARGRCDKGSVRVYQRLGPISNAQDNKDSLWKF